MVEVDIETSPPHVVTSLVVSITSVVVTYVDSWLFVQLLVE